MKPRFAARIAACALLAALAGCRGAAPARTAALPPMEYAQLCEAPGRCLILSRLVLGTDHLGKMDPGKTAEVLDEAARLGINAFDTSPIYAGGVEARLGGWLRARPGGGRGFYVISKGGFPRDLGPGAYDSRLKGSAAAIAAAVLEEIEVSDRQLGHNIAVYLLHRDDADFRGYVRAERPRTPAADILAAMAAPEIRKRYRLLGVSNWEAPRVAEALAAAAADPALPKPVLSSPYFSLLEWSTTTTHSGGAQARHAEMSDPAFEPGIKIMPYSPLGGFSIVRRGWAAARAEALRLKQEGDRYWGHAYDAIFHAANERRFRRAERFAKDFNKAHGTNYTVDQVLNAYALAHRRTDFLAIGPRSVEQLRQTVEALRLARELTQADLDYLYGGPEGGR